LDAGSRGPRTTIRREGVAIHGAGGVNIDGQREQTSKEALPKLKLAAISIIGSVDLFRAPETSINRPYRRRSRRCKSRGLKRSLGALRHLWLSRDARSKSRRRSPLAL
jgi:hypothetical protein